MSYDLNSLTYAEDANQINAIYFYFIFYWLAICPLCSDRGHKMLTFPMGVNAASVVWSSGSPLLEVRTAARRHSFWRTLFTLTSNFFGQSVVFFLGKKRLQVVLKNVRRLVGGCRRCARSHDTIHTGSVTFLKVTPTSQIKLSYSSFVSRLA